MSKRFSKSNHKSFRKGGRASKIIAILSGVVVFFAAGWFFMDARGSGIRSKDATAAESQAEVQRPKPSDYAPLIGRWQRPDGGYVLEIRSVGADGRMDAGYYNPNPIHVARAEAVGQGGTFQIYVELQDRGYPGATYQLIYQKNQKALTGLYYQPAVGGSFDVFFVKQES